jgi:hypothetical protein
VDQLNLYQGVRRRTHYLRPPFTTNEEPIA